MTKKNKATKVSELMKKFPAWSAMQIAEKAGCTASYVWRLRKELGDVFDLTEDMEIAQDKLSDVLWNISKGKGRIPPEPEADPVNSPPHYTDGGIETIDYIEAKLTPEEFRGYCLGNAHKYLSRAGKKGSATTDLQKAQWYLARITH
jgi:hypothetical protein